MIVSWRHNDVSVESIRDATGDRRIGGEFSFRRASRVGIAPEPRANAAGRIPFGSGAELAACLGQLACDRFGQALTELTVEVAEVGERVEPLAGIDAQRLLELSP